MSFGLKSLECVFEEGNKAYMIILCMYVYLYIHVCLVYLYKYCPETF